MTLKNDEKFEVKLTCCLKIYMSTLSNLIEGLKNLQINGLLLTKVLIFELKKYRGVIFHDTEE